MSTNRRSGDDIIAQLLRKPTLRNCVVANCVSCIYDDLVPGTWRQQVEMCTVETCTIYEVRAKSKSQKKDLIFPPLDNGPPAAASKDPGFLEVADG